MATGQHRGTPKGGSSPLVPAGIGLASIPAGVIVVITSVVVLLRYSASEDPGALPAGVWLFVVGLFMILLPVVYLILRGVLHETRVYRAWKAALTPAQRVWVTLAEAAAFWGGHELWKHHNERESARLTRSVMGPERD